MFEQLLLVTSCPLNNPDVNLKSPNSFHSVNFFFLFFILKLEKRFSLFYDYFVIQNHI